MLPLEKRELDLCTYVYFLKHSLMPPFLLSCFFRPICHFYRLLHIWQAILAFMLVLTVRIRKCVECRWMPFHFGPSFHVSSDQQDSRICRHIECSLMVFHLGADFHVSLGQQDSQIWSCIKSSWIGFSFCSWFSCTFRSSDSRI